MNRELEFSEVLLRAKECFGCEKDSELAAVLGMSPQTLGNRKKSQSLPYEEIVDKAFEKGIDLQYILTGKQNVYKPVKEKSTDYQNPIYAEIPHFNISAAAGNGVIVETEEQLQPLSFRRDWLVKRRLSPANLVIVDVHGDSMEPYLKDDDLVLVDRSQIGINSGKTYVLRMGDHLLVKNLQLLPHGLVQVASFNAGFPPYQVDLADESLDMTVIGRVVASMHEW